VAGTTLYLRGSTGETTGVPTTPQSASRPTADAGSFNVHDLLEEVGVAPDLVAGPVTGLPQLGVQHIYLGKWVSKPLAGISKVTAQTWTGAVAAAASAASTQAVLGVSVYVLRQNGTVRGYVYDADVAIGNPLPTSAKGREFSFAGAQVTSVQPADRLVVELWVKFDQLDDLAHNTRARYDGSTLPVEDVADTDAASWVATPQTGLFAPQTQAGSTKLYLADSSANAGAISGFEQSASMTPNSAISTVKDLVGAAVGGPEIPVTLPRLMGGHLDVRGYFGKWATLPLAGLAGGALPAGDYTINLSASEFDAAMDAFIVPVIYVVQADGTIRGYVYDQDVDVGLEVAAGTTRYGHSVTVTGAGVAGIAADDQLVVEVWYRATTIAPSFGPGDGVTIAYAGATDPVDGTPTTDAASYVVIPASGLFGVGTAQSNAGTITPTGALTISAPSAITPSGGIAPAGALTMTLPALPPGDVPGPGAGPGIRAAGVIAPQGELTMRQVGVEAEGVCGPQPYLTVCGAEVINYARTFEYVQRFIGIIDHLVDPPAQLYRTLGYFQSFISPSEDPAPWFDPGIIASAEFLGVIGTPEVSEPLTRTVTERATGGGSLGPPRVGPRVVTVTDGWLVATTTRGLEYGHRWLAEALAGCVGCGTCDAVIYQTPGDEDPGEDARSRYALYEVGLTTAPVIKNRISSAQGPSIGVVDFALTAGRGELYRDPQIVLPLSDLPPSPDIAPCVPFDVWLCSEPPTTLDVVVTAPPKGEVGAIITIDCTTSGIGGVTIHVRDTCEPGDVDVQRIDVFDLETGSIFIVDSARERFTYIRPDGVRVDGSDHVILGTDQAPSFIALDACDAPSRCLSIVRTRYCNDDPDVRVAVQAQERHR
jgi:hypothetical protein